MTPTNFSRRIERLEAVRGAFDVTSMSDAEIRQHMDETLQALGGREAALAAMAACPWIDPAVIQTVEEWPAWPQ